MNWKVPLFDTDFGQDEQDAVLRVLKSGWLTMGEEINAFEREFANFLNVKYAFMVSSCTAALHLAHHVLGAGPGDEVICPSLTFVATASAIAQTGASPVLADIISKETLTISPEDISRKISPRTKGIAVMHYAGYPCLMDEIMKIAGENHLYVVEDCAHSPGASLKGKMTGTFGDVGCFSFFSNKNLSTGEGGMVVTNRDDLAQRIKLLRSHGMTTNTLDRHKGHSMSYDVMEKGFNYRSGEINAAMGRVQLKRLGGKNIARMKIVEKYRALLYQDSSIVVPFKNAGESSVSACHIFPIVLPEGADRSTIASSLRENGIQSSVHYRPIHTFTAYVSATPYNLPVTESLKYSLLTLPLYPAMTEDHVNYVVESLTSGSSSLEIIAVTVAFSKNRRNPSGYIEMISFRYLSELLKNRASGPGKRSIFVGPLEPRN